MNSNIETKSLSARSDLHILRKLCHIFFGVTSIGIYFLSGIDIVIWGWTAVAIACFGFSVDLVRLNSPKVNRLIVKFLGPFMRESERDGFNGTPFYALGMGLCIVFYQEDIAIISILFLVFADPIASFVGVYMGKDKILPNKSLQGTIAAFFVCYLIAMLYLQNLAQPNINMLIFGILAGVVGAISELASAFNIDDNLTIPLISGGGLSVLNYIFQVI